jgi:archaellum component FlaC
MSMLDGLCKIFRKKGEAYGKQETIREQCRLEEDS